MTELIQAANNLTWPGAIAVAAVCFCIVGVVFAFAWMVRG